MVRVRVGTVVRVRVGTVFVDMLLSHNPCTYGGYKPVIYIYNAIYIYINIYIPYI